MLEEGSALAEKELQLYYRSLADKPKQRRNVPRCGTTKTNFKAVGFNVQKWSKNFLTYKIMNFPTGQPQSVIRYLLDKAFSAWSNVTNLDFAEVTFVDRADIEVVFGGQVHWSRGERCSFPMDTDVFAHAFYPEEGNVHFNTKYYFDGGESLGQFLEVAMHEIGHVLGLDHSKSKASLMHLTEIGRFTEPQPIDVKNIQRLYGVRGESMRAAGSRLCSLTAMDAAIQTSDGVIYVFAGDYFYDVKNKFAPGKLISSKWKGLPGNIDAAFTYNGEKTFFFKNNLYWTFNETRMLPGHPRQIRDGFPGLPDNLDATLVSDGDIYAFRDDQYWYYSVKDKRISGDSPSSTRRIHLPTTHFDAALNTESAIMTFKGGNFFRWSDGGRSVQMLRNSWLQC
ncbi:matrix metalloproteinase-19 [Culex quinquefasciatus]|uniref:matrix metalloproteinase-19 n=1 Tax=Culex quinquefasciatus TaxID=7176 RepID=UPI0018E2DC89|nr:matrix metalloproteinase-19 [Culex quinquefasciatus]